MNRTICITDKLKFGNMAAVYFHFDVDEAGNVVRRQMSVPGKYDNKELGALLDAIARRINADSINETSLMADAIGAANAG